MGFSRVEVNLRRLLAAAPGQQIQTKLIHYVATLHEQLEKLAEEKTSDGLPRVSKATINKYSEQIEDLAAKLAILESNTEVSEGSSCVAHFDDIPIKIVDNAHSLEGMRRRIVKLQEDLTDEMVGLARELKERGLLMSQSVRNTEKLLDSAEKAIERSLASTGHANTRAMEVHSQSSKTSCFTWLVMFAMTCVFVMVVLLIRVT